MIMATLEHTLSAPQKPEAVLVIGGGGFVGGAVVQRLAALGVDAVSPPRAQLDLLAEDAQTQLRDLLPADGTLVVTAAKAPVRDTGMLLDNLRMFESIRAVLEDEVPGHVVYVSSDAVYPDEPVPLNESVPPSPTSLHGVMHLVREVILRTYCKAPLAIVRPTLIYGVDDPHNGYGPNRFRRLAAKGEDIVLFGEGEERRDHVDVADVGELVARIVMNRSQGVLNAATGTVASFKELADHTVSLFAPPVAVKRLPRVGPMPHNGYRPFDPAATARAFPDFRYTGWKFGLSRAKTETQGA